MVASGSKHDEGLANTEGRNVKLRGPHRPLHFINPQSACLFAGLKLVFTCVLYSGFR